MPALGLRTMRPLRTIPDFYQGSELWDLSLVDPDNRRPVDYELRRRLLSELDGLTLEQLCSRIDEGMPKTVADPPNSQAET